MHVVGRARGQEYGGTAQIFRAAPTSCGNACEDFAIARFVGA